MSSLSVDAARSRSRRAGEVTLRRCQHHDLSSSLQELSMSNGPSSSEDELDPRLERERRASWSDLVDGPIGSGRSNRSRLRQRCCRKRRAAITKRPKHSACAACWSGRSSIGCAVAAVINGARSVRVGILVGVIPYVKEITLELHVVPVVHVEVLQQAHLL